MVFNAENRANRAYDGPVRPPPPKNTLQNAPHMKTDDFMKMLDPEIAPRVQKLESATAKSPSTQTPAEVRAAFLRARQPLKRAPNSLQIHDLSIRADDAALEIRVYRPISEVALPGMIYMHGGGFTNGDLDSHDAICCCVAEYANIVLFSVNYRVLPDHPFPAAFNDAVASLRWLRQHAGEHGVDPARLAAGGDSSGANLALAAALELRGQVSLQALWLAYPIIGADFNTPSYIENAQAPLLTRARCQRILHDYLGRELQADDWRAAPLLARDLSGLPPTVAIGAQFDPLYSDAEILCTRLRQTGTISTLVQAPGMPHGFLRWIADSPASRRIALDSLLELKKFL